MTLSTTGIRVGYAGNSSATAFPFPYKFDANGDLVVILRDASANESTQIQGTNYTVTGAGLDAGGTVTMLVAPPTGTTLTIIRQPPITQLTSYNDNDPFPAKSHEAALDKRTEVEQWLADQLGRTLRLKATDAVGTGSFQAGGQRVSFVADAAGLNDAVTLEQLLAVQSLIGLPGGTPVFSYASRLAASLATIANTVSYLLTAGYASVGDQGEAIYKRDVSLTAGGFQSIDGAYWTLMSTPVRPQHFGAKADGVTDDTIAIQNALNSLTAGGTLYFPRGTYMISMVNNVGGVYALNAATAGISVVGAGPIATTVKNKNSAAVVAMFQMSGASQSVRNLTLDGNRLNGGGITTVEPNCSGVTSLAANFTLDNCEIKNVNLQGIIFGGSANNLAVTNCYMHDIGRVSDTVGTGIKMVGSPAGGVLRGNIITSCYGLTVPGASGGLNVGGSAIALGGTQMVVDGNYMANCYNSGGMIAEQNAGGVQGVVRDWVISNNVFIINTEPATAATYGIEISGQNYAITGNIFDVGAGGIGGGIIFETAPTFVTGGATVASNLFLGGAYGVRLLEVGGSGTPRYVSVVGNKFKGQTTNAIEISVHSSQIVVCGNQLSEMTTPLNNLAATGEVICEGNAPATVGSPRVSLGLPAPTSTGGAITTASATLKYHRRGKEIDYHLTVVVTTNGTGAGAIQVTGFPVGAFANQHILVGQNVTSGKMIACALTNGGTAGIIKDYSGAYPATSGDTLQLDGVVEVA